MKQMMMKAAVKGMSLTEKFHPAKLMRRRQGQGMIEWILIVALIAVAVIALLIMVKGKIGGKLGDIGNALS